MIVLPHQKSDGFEVEQKNLTDITTQAGIETLMFGLQNPNSWQQVSDRMAAQFYQENSVVFSAIDIIAQEFARIAPIVRDVESGEIIDDHPVLNLLKKPNPYDTEDSFLGAWARNFLISGNTFLTADGDVLLPPQMIFAILSQNVEIRDSQTDGYPLEYRVTKGGRSSFINYVRTATPSLMNLEQTERFGLFRFYAHTTQSRERQDLEIFHTRNYNPNVSRSNSIGLSKLSSVFYEANQLNEGNVHNWSQLKRGARPTAIISEEEGFNFTDDQLEKLKSQFNNLYSGAENAGRPLFLPNGLAFAEFGTSNKDMDYMALKSSASDSIYNVYRVPLALMSTQSMTLDNFKEAKLFLYDNAVIPLADLLYGEMTNFLIPRYGEDPFKVRITIDLDNIPALESRRLDRVQKMSMLGIMTTNELRRDLGLDDLEGGDTVLLPSNLLPLLAEAEIDRIDPRQTMSKKTMDKKQIENKAITLCSPEETARNIAQTIVDGDGQRLFSDEDIRREADKVKPKKKK
jgi:HK97 family phage portal protein